MNDSITCPRCKTTSYNPNEIRERYCQSCHDWHQYMSEFDRELIACVIVEDGAAEVTYSCGHKAIWIVPPHPKQRYIVCAQCVNGWIEERK